jgi:transposase
MKQETGRHRFTTIPTNPKALHDLIVDGEPDRVVIEICSIAGWVSDLVRALGIEIQIANANDERWQWRKVKTKNDRADALKLAQLSAPARQSVGAVSVGGSGLVRAAS